MPQQTLAACLKTQLADVTPREKSRLSGIVNRCTEAYRKVRDIQRTIANEPATGINLAVVERWSEAKNEWQSSLDRLRTFVDIPKLFQVVIDTGPRCY